MELLSNYQRAYEEFENGEFETSLQWFQNTATVLEAVHTVAADVGLEELRSEAERTWNLARTMQTKFGTC